MKKKIIILTLCFTVIISSINLKKSYANPLIAFTPQMVGVLTTIAVAGGIVISDENALYDLCRGFYEVNKDTWDVVQLAFKSLTFDKTNGETVLNEDLLKICNDTFGYLFNLDSYKMDGVISITDKYGLNSIPLDVSSVNGEIVSIDKDGITVFAKTVIGTYAPEKYKYDIYVKDENKTYFSVTTGGWKDFYSPSVSFINNGVKVYYLDNMGRLTWAFSGSVFTGSNSFNTYSSSYTGTYNPVEDMSKVKVPTNVGDLIGLGSSGVLNPGYDVSLDGIVSVPGVSNPSIDVTDSIPFPGVGDTTTDIPGDTTTDTPIDTPSDTVWDKVKDFIISLVVPADSFWTDTFGGLRGSFESAFPMVDMSNFNNLIVGGKPFPNIYVDVFGSRCKIVDGDVINSIADWLRPLIAGFMMLCLMFFNYRKIYKLIRNTEPFGNIAPGTSDFRTGLSSPVDMPGSSAPSNYEIARDQLRDVAFEMRSEILARKHRGDI